MEDLLGRWLLSIKFELVTVGEEETVGVGFRGRPVSLSSWCGCLTDPLGALQSEVCTCTNTDTHVLYMHVLHAHVYVHVW